VEEERPCHRGRHGKSPAYNVPWVDLHNKEATAAGIECKESFSQACSAVHIKGTQE
jgi:hypothetical protein